MDGNFATYLRGNLEKEDAIDPSVRRFFLSGETACVFGAGMQARIVLDLAKFYGKPISSLLVSDGGQRNLDAFYDYVPCRRVSELDPGEREAEVLIAVNGKYVDEIASFLRDADFMKIHQTKDWERINSTMQSLWCRSYFDFHGFSTILDSNGDMHREYSPQNTRGGGGVKYTFYFPENDTVFISNIFPIINDVLLPPLLGDCNYLNEGPYEHSGAVLHSGDVVFDLGANVGLFSAVAAAKGCNVFAFEPTPGTRGYLRKNAALHSNITVLPFAVTRSSGKISFYADPDTQNTNMGQSSILQREKFSRIDADSVSIDDFVETNGIKRVDFIKADIEGAEREMLAGAKRTLRRFAPKLALCTYHLPDDPEVMENLILEANPDYTIEHKWSKLYAYCKTT